MHMQKMYFGTQRLVCRPLEEKDICALRRITEEQHVQQFFQFGDLSDFLQELNTYECFPVGVFQSNMLIACKSSGSVCSGFSQSNRLVGYINGYVYNAQNHEMLVEFFLTENYYRFDYVTELLRAYINNCRKIGFSTFFFVAESTDTELVSMLTNMSEVHGCPEEDFTDESDDDGKKKYFRVFKIF